jgi:hypothetical protein
MRAYLSEHRDYFEDPRGTARAEAAMALEVVKAGLVPSMEDVPPEIKKMMKDSQVLEYCHATDGLPPVGCKTSLKGRFVMNNLALEESEE